MADDPVVPDQQTLEVDEPSSDHVPASESGVEETPSSESDAAADESADESLITDARYEELKDDPVKLRAELQKAFTQKTQALAKARKDLAAWADVKASYEEDPTGTIIDVARRAGLEIVDPRAAKEEPLATRVDLDTQIVMAVKESLGPEYEDLADRLAPAIRKVTEAIVTNAQKPLQDRQEQLIAESALRESETILTGFEKAHPDLKDYAPRMSQLMEQVQPGVDPKTGKPRLSETEYLELLYQLAKPTDVAVGEKAKGVIKRMTDSARAAAKDSGGVGKDKIDERPTGPVSFDEAARLAMQSLGMGTK